MALGALLCPADLSSGVGPRYGTAARSDAPTTITNRVDVRWTDESGVADSTQSNAVVLTVGSGAAVSIQPPGNLSAAPGTRIFFAHTVTNDGPAADCIELTVLGGEGMGASVHLLAPGESPSTNPSNPPVAGCVDTAAGASVEIVVVLQVPAEPGAGVLSITVEARSGTDPSTFGQVQDRITVLFPASADIEKTVDKATAHVGDTLTYTIRFAITGSGTLTGVTLTDTLPGGAGYVPGTLVLNGGPQTDADDGDPSSYDPAPRAILATLGDLPAGSNGTLRFRVTVDTVPAGGALTNTARLAGGGGGPGGVLLSATASTGVSLPTPDFEKRARGPDPALMGQDVRFTIRYGNPTSVVLKSVVVTDTLPAELEWVSSDPPPTQIAGRVISWQLGDLAPGATDSIVVVGRVSDTVTETVRAVNRATISSTNGADSEDDAEVTVIALEADQLELDKTAGLLEAGIGERAPYTLELRNRGSSALTGLVVVDTLPHGVEFEPRSVSGADSVRREGRVVTFIVRGPLAPGDIHRIRYSVVIVAPGGELIRNVAWGTAENGSLRTSAVAAIVRVRASWPMESRLVFGRVWVDGDGDGRQSDGEGGLAGVDIWSEDGLVSTTDEDGRFSFRDVRPGGHAFHLDEATLPVSVRVARPGGAIVSLTADGWTSPLVNFRVVPRAADLVEVRRLARVDTLDEDSPPEDCGVGTRPPPQQNSMDGPDPCDAARSDDLPNSAVTDTLPDPSGLEPGEQVEVTLRPAGAGWPDVVFPLPDRWTWVTGSARLGEHPIPDPEVESDREGKPVLQWHLEGESPGPLRLRLAPTARREEEPRPQVPRLLSPAEREAQRGHSVTVGPGVTIFDPADGSISSRDRLYIGVRGDANAPIALFDGDSLIAETSLRIDGMHDFIAVPLDRGPHRLRVRMRNSWGHERWDSVAVHVTGLPASFLLDGAPLRLTADGNSVTPVRIRVLDRWGVPVTDRPRITVLAEGAEPTGRDEDTAAPGLQVSADEAGWVSLRLKAGTRVGEGVLRLRWSGVEGRIPLRLTPDLRSLIVTGYGRVGVGANPEDFAALTARGRLDDRTSLTVSYDSRRLDAGRDFFGRGFDPLDESRYPLVGDASQERTLGAAQGSFAARLERDLDWVAFGDLTLDDFSDGLRLTTYRRALSGAQARVTAGPVTWRGFGSLTGQKVQQLLLRGAGTAGPYLLAGGLRPGTERVVLETRDRLNAQQILNQDPLARFVDYQIDYDAGALLLKRPVPATDVFGNPMFIVVTYEADGGAEEVVAGVRASVALDELLSTGVDSLRLGFTGVRGGGGDAGHYLTGADASLQAGSFKLGAEVSYSTASDSAGFALGLDGAVGLLGDRVGLGWRWTRVGDRYFNPADITLRAGTEELHLEAGYDLRQVGKLRFTHARQRFDAQAVSREQTGLRLERKVGEDVRVAADLADDRLDSRGRSDASFGGGLELKWQATPRLGLFAEGRRLFSHAGRAANPDQISAGAEFSLSDGLTFQTRHRMVFLPADSAGAPGTRYSLTDVGFRSALLPGTELRAGYQLAGGADGLHNAAVIGLNNRFKLGNAWSVESLFERRVGIDNAPEEDPVRALPFLQAEEDYWSAAVGLELLPPDRPYRFSARSELREGDFRSTRIASLGGEVAFDRSLALLSRQEFVQTEQPRSSGPEFSRRRSSLWGLAFRPVGTDAVNLLGKFEWVDELNPARGGVLTGEGEESRLIGIAEVVWSPGSMVELGGRYAVRFTNSRVPDEATGTRRLASRSDYLGTRLRLKVGRALGLEDRLALALDGRLLNERLSSRVMWDLAPSVELLLFGPTVLEGGYRFGDLRDPDFSVRGGRGAFFTMGVQVTEKAFASAADFWRARF